MPDVASPIQSLPKRAIYVSKCTVDELAHREAGSDTGDQFSRASVAHQYAFPVPESAHEELGSTPMMTGGPTLDQIMASAHGEESRMTSMNDEAPAWQRGLLGNAARDLSQDLATEDTTAVLNCGVRSW
jgi:hypothetical protein